MNMKRIFTILTAVCLLLGVCFCVNACNDASEDNNGGADGQKGPAEYVVYVNDAEDAALSGIGVSVYAENDKDSLVWFALTGEDGKVTFTEESSVNYIAVLANVPAEYELKESYALSAGETKITLSKASSDETATPEAESTSQPTDGDVTEVPSTDSPEDTGDLLSTEQPAETETVPDNTADNTTGNQTSAPATSTPVPTEQPSKIPVTPANKGTPIEIGGVLEFDAEVKAGQAMCYNVYRVSGTTLKIQSDDAYVTYNGTTYMPKNGVVEFSVTSEGMTAPVYLEIGNSSKADKTFKVSFTYPLGTQDNPHTFKFEEFTVHTDDGNEQGVYYTYTTNKAGTLTIDILSVSPSNANVKITVDVISPSDVVKQTSNVDEDDNVGTNVTVEVAAGDRIKVNFGVLPDDENKIPAADVKIVVNYG